MPKVETAELEYPGPEPEWGAHQSRVEVAAETAAYPKQAAAAETEAMEAPSLVAVVVVAAAAHTQAAAVRPARMVSQYWSPRIPGTRAAPDPATKTSMAEPAVPVAAQGCFPAQVVRLALLLEVRALRAAPAKGDSAEAAVVAVAPPKAGAADLAAPAQALVEAEVVAAAPMRASARG